MRIAAALVGVVVGLAVPASLSAQTPTRLRAYIEQCQCFDDFIREEISWVDFVRQPQDADLQVIGNTTQTGAGGVERTLRFVGAGSHAGTDFTLRATTLPNEPVDVQRRALLRVVQVGLLRFAARDGLPDGIELEVTAEQQAEAADTTEEDPWNLWVFEIGGNASIEAEESSSERAWEVSVEADRVTRDWIVNFNAEVENETEAFDLDDDDEEGGGAGGREVEVTTRQRSVRLFLAKALGRHWSMGFDTDIESSTFENVDLRTTFMPAIEYSVFPYAEYASRQLRLEYAVGMMHARYNEVTLFDRLRETRPQHSLSATLEQRQPWGSVESRVEWSQYLHDPSLSRLQFNGDVSLRLVRGLSLDIGGSASRIRDQISLPRRGATPEEVLLRVRQLQSGYRVRLFVGVSYSFGSIYNNIVNPRFGGGGGGGGGGFF